jgi:F-box-like
MKKARAKTKLIDKLSNLPDVLLLYILSFLKARKAAQTCILSKRWRSMWAYTPSIYLDYAEFRNQGSIDQEKFFALLTLFLSFRKSHK